MNSFQAFSLQIARTGSLLGKSGIPSNIGGGIHLRSFSSLFLSRSGAEQKTLLQGSLTTRTEGDGAFQQSLWNHQQVRTKKRGTEYQPNNIKRKRTHGWIKRMRTPGGIEVILRRMLKGRKSLTH